MKQKNIHFPVFQMNADEMRIKVEEAKARRLAELAAERERQRFAFEERVAYFTSDALARMFRNLEFSCTYCIPYNVTSCAVEYDRYVKKVAFNLQQKGYETTELSDKLNKIAWGRGIIIQLPSKDPETALPNQINPVAASKHTDAPPSYQDQDKPPEYPAATNPRKCCYL
jgi:hypothetical protein